MMKSSKPNLTQITKTVKRFGAGNEIRTRDTKLGKLVLYQLSYARFRVIGLS